MTEEEIEKYAMELERYIKEASMANGTADCIDLNMFPSIKIEEPLLKKTYRVIEGKNITPLEQLVDDYQYLYLIGDAGSGKTTAIDYLEAKMLSENKPVYKIKLKDSNRGYKYPDLDKEMETFPMGTVIILDGMDEEYQSLNEIVERVENLRKKEQFKVVVTCRYDINENNYFKGFQRAYIQRLDETQIDNVLIKERIEVDKKAIDFDLCGTPFFLSIIKQLANKTPTKIFNSETDLLMTYFQLLYEGKGGDSFQYAIQKIGEGLFSYRRNGKFKDDVFKDNVFNGIDVNKYLSSIFSIEKTVQGMHLIYSHETYADFVVGYYLAGQIKENIEILEKLNCEDDKSSTPTELGFLSRKSLWFTGKILQREPQNAIKKRFQTFNKRIKKASSLLYSYIVNIYISYNNDVIENTETFKIGKAYYELLKNYGFYGINKLKIKTKRNFIFRYNVVMIDENKECWLLNTSGAYFYDAEKALKCLINSENSFQDDKMLKDIINRQVEVVEYKKTNKRISNFNDFNEIFITMLIWILIIPLFIFIFIKWGLVTPLSIVENLYSKIAQVDNIVLNWFAATGGLLLLVIVSLIISVISVFAVYGIFFLVYSFILKIKIEKVAINFALRFGFDVYYHKFDILWIGQNVRFLLQKKNYEDLCMDAIELITRASSNKEIACKSCMKLAREYEEKGDFFNAFLYARAMKEFSIASEEEWINLKNILE